MLDIYLLIYLLTYILVLAVDAGALPLASPERSGYARVLSLRQTCFKLSTNIASASRSYVQEFDIG